MDQVSLVSALKELDQLFTKASRENVPELWGEYIQQRLDFEEAYIKAPLVDPSIPTIFGVSLADALDKDPVGQSPQTVRRWIKCLHLVDAPHSILADRYVVLNEYLGIPA